MYLYLYFKYFFGWVLVLVLKILLKSILPITGANTSCINVDKNRNSEREHMRPQFTVIL